MATKKNNAGITPSTTRTKKKVGPPFKAELEKKVPVGPWRLAPSVAAALMLHYKYGFVTQTEMMETAIKELTESRKADKAFRRKFLSDLPK